MPPASRGLLDFHSSRSQLSHRLRRRDDDTRAADGGRNDRQPDYAAVSAGEASRRDVPPTRRRAAVNIDVMCEMRRVFARGRFAAPSAFFARRCERPHADANMPMPPQR